MDLNKVMLIWRVTTDIELKKLGESWNSVVSFSLATNRRYKNKEWNLVEEAEFNRCVVFWLSADNFSKYVSKWSKLYVEGRLKTRKWEDTSGTTKYTTEIIVESFIFLDSKWWSDSTQQSSDNSKSTQQQDEELPF